MNICICDDREQWNEAVLSFGGALYQSWEWGELRAPEGWRPWRLLFKDATGSVVAAVNVLERRLPLGLSLMYGVRGILGCESRGDHLAEVVKSLREFVRAHGAILLRLDPRVPDTDKEYKSLLLRAGLKSRPEQWSLWNRPRFTMAVDLTVPEPELLARMKKIHRNRVHRVQRSGLAIEIGSSSSHIEEFYKLLQKTSERQQIVIRQLSYFQRVRELLMTQDRGAVFIARQEGKAVAAISCARFGKACHFVHGGFDWEARTANANEYLHYRAMLWGKEHGCVKYTLGGAGTRYPPEQQNSGYSLYHFKQGFGADDVYSVGYFDLIGNPMAALALRAAERHSGLLLRAKKILFERSRARSQSVRVTDPIQP
jgi:lipid II:glycine glycyltransferase (peptidoglycan interpeptide bridge formation enzyme)